MKKREGYVTDLRNFNIYIDRVDNKLTFKALSIKYNLSTSCIKKIINNLKCKLLDYTFNYKQKKEVSALKDALREAVRLATTCQNFTFVRPSCEVFIKKAEELLK